MDEFRRNRRLPSQMIFGTPNTFAIEADFIEISGKWTYGHLRFWMNGFPLGDFDDTSDLASSARWGRTFLAASSRGVRADLAGLDPGQVYELLYGQYVRPIGGTPGAPATGHWDRDPYVLDDLGESALRDRFAVIAVGHGSGTVRVIARDFNTDTTSAVLLPRQELIQVVDSYCHWAEGLRQRAS